jgi:uncharacterized protein
MTSSSLPSLDTASPAPDPDTSPKYDAREILAEILAGFPLRHDKNHGIGHWARVLQNGRHLARRLNLPSTVVELFALVHDSQRLVESVDREHGARAGIYVQSLAKRGLIRLSDDELHQLTHACHYHSAGMMAGPPVVQICWDADRLDLARVGALPLSAKLCTDVAREPEFFAKAVEQGRQRVLPALVCSEWGITWTGPVASVAGPTRRADST